MLHARERAARAERVLGGGALGGRAPGRLGFSPAERRPGAAGPEPALPGLAARPRVPLAREPARRPSPPGPRATLPPRARRRPAEGPGSRERLAALTRSCEGDEAGPEGGGGERHHRWAAFWYGRTGERPPPRREPPARPLGRGHQGARPLSAGRASGAGCPSSAPHLPPAHRPVGLGPPCHLLGDPARHGPLPPPALPLPVSQQRAPPPPAPALAPSPALPGPCSLRKGLVAPAHSRCTRP